MSNSYYRPFLYLRQAPLHTLLFTLAAGYSVFASLEYAKSLEIAAGYSLVVLAIVWELSKVVFLADFVRFGIRKPLLSAALLAVASLVCVGSVGATAGYLASKETRYNEGKQDLQRKVASQQLQDNLARNPTHIALLSEIRMLDAQIADMRQLAREQRQISHKRQSYETFAEMSPLLDRRAAVSDKLAEIESDERSKISTPPNDQLVLLGTLFPQIVPERAAMYARIGIQVLLSLTIDIIGALALAVAHIRVVSGAFSGTFSGTFGGTFPGTSRGTKTYPELPPDSPRRRTRKRVQLRLVPERAGPVDDTTYRKIKNALQEGRAKPTHRSLRRFGVGQETADAYLRQLEAEGVIVAGRGRRYRIAS